MRKVKIMDIGSGKTSADFYISVLETPADPAVGSGLAELLKTVPLITLLKQVTACQDHVLLEDALWQTLHDRLVSPRLGVTKNSQDALTAIMNVVEATRADVAEKT